MNKTPKAYRDDLSKDFYTKRKDTNEKIKRIQDNPDFLESHKAEAIKVVKDKLYKELDDTIATKEYQGAKSKKQALRGKKKDVKKQEDIVVEQKKILEDKEAELGTMSEEYGEKFEKKTEKKEIGKITKEHLLNKPNMTAKDKANMEKSIKFLVDKKMDTSENLKKLEAINYGSNYIEIAGLKFSREKFVPEAKFNDKPNSSNVFESNKKGIYKTIYNGSPEYFLTTDQYINQTKKQGKTAIENSHIRQALQALPGEFLNNNSYAGANILGNILGLSMSGYVLSDGRLWNEDRYGYLSSAFPVDKNDARAFEFNEDRGKLDTDYNGNDARPCLSLIK